VYTGDAAPTARLAEFSDGADLLISECSAPDEFAGPHHLAPADIGPMAEQARVRHLLLTHFYPECDRADIRQQVSKWYSGPVSLAHDGMRLEI
jgi:ribonuclease BN (tRNA processing enzyme)